VELKDYSGDYNPDIKFEDFSQEALIRLIKAYQVVFVGLMGTWNGQNKKRMSVEEAWNLDSEVYEEQVKNFEVPMVRDAMKIGGNDVISMLKYFQMTLDGAREGLYECNWDVKNNNHAVLTFTKCPSLFYYERMDSLKDIECLCAPGGCEDRAFRAIADCFNPAIQCNALKLPPRENKDDICCIWEFKIES